MIGWILAGLAAATVYNVVKDNDNTKHTSQAKRTIKVRCRNCGNELVVPDMFHVEGTCPKCHGNYIVENGIVKSKGELTVSCISCGRDVKVPGAECVEAKCDYCGSVFISDRGKVYRKNNESTTAKSASQNPKTNNDSKGKVYQNNTINTQSTTAKSTPQNSKANKDKGIRVNLNKPLMQIIEGKIVGSQYAIVSKNKVYFDNNDTVLYINTDSGKYEFTDHNKVNIQIEKTLTSNDLSFGLINTAGVFAQYKSNSLPYNFEDVCSTMSYQANKEFGLETKYGICMTLTSNGIKFRYNGKYINIEEAIKVVSDEKNAITPVNNNNSTVQGNMSELDNLKWMDINETVIQNANAGVSAVPKNTGYFVPNGYVCPQCNNNLSKVLINKYPLLKGKTNCGIIDKVFTCKYCQTLMIPYYEKPLSYGAYAMAYVPSNKYQNIVEILDNNSRGTPGSQRIKISTDCLEVLQIILSKPIKFGNYNTSVNTEKVYISDNDVYFDCGTHVFHLSTASGRCEDIKNINKRISNTVEGDKLIEKIIWGISVFADTDLLKTDANRQYASATRQINEMLSKHGSEHMYSIKIKKTGMMYFEDARTISLEKMISQLYD